MQYKGLEITAFEQQPGKWCARIVAVNGRPLKGDDRKLLELVTSANLASAVDALTLAMEAVDAAGLFIRNADRGMERFWRVFLRTSETSGVRRRLAAFSRSACWTAHLSTSEFTRFCSSSFSSGDSGRGAGADPNSLLKFNPRKKSLSPSMIVKSSRACSRKRFVSSLFVSLG
jgi:hypothetical protein